MPLGTNPRFSQIRAFFGGSANFKDYYRGGPYVPNIAANNAIPTSPAGMKMSQFSGADKVTAPPTPTLQGANVSADVYASSGSASADCYIELRNNGKVFSHSSSYGDGDVSTWLPAGRSAGEYMARRSTDGGATWEGWQSLSNNFSCVGTSAWSDGFYSDSSYTEAVVQIGYGGNVQAQATFSAAAAANGRG